MAIRTRHAAAALAAISPALAMAEVIDVDLDAPRFDRWMYPYNATPGARETAPVFSSLDSGFDIFDDRDGQILLGFETAKQVPAGHGAAYYQVLSATLTITLSIDGVVHDPTSDPWQSFVPDSGVDDADSGRPLELFAAAFRNGFDGWTFGEDGPFPFGAQRGQRNGYPLCHVPDLGAVDASNNVLEGFDPPPAAVGEAIGFEPGVVLPSETVITFELDVDDADLQCYLRQRLDEGLVTLVLTSLHASQPPGVRGSAIWPYFHMKESLSVVLGLADASQLTMEVVAHDPPAIPEDLDGDGTVGVNDLLIVLADWGPCGCCASDVDSNGQVNINDLLALIGAWG